MSHLLTLLPLLKPEEGAQSSASNAPAALADPASPDLTLKTIEALRDVCLAQAQEVFWSKGVMGDSEDCVHSGALSNNN